MSHSDKNYLTVVRKWFTICIWQKKKTTLPTIPSVGRLPDSYLASETRRLSPTRDAQPQRGSRLISFWDASHVLSHYYSHGHVALHVTWTLPFVKVRWTLQWTSPTTKHNAHVTIPTATWHFIFSPLLFFLCACTFTGAGPMNNFLLN